MYGILGGTFDPVHLGHLALGEEALRLGMETVFWVPSNVPPHRGTPKSLATHRAKMVELAIEGKVQFRLDKREQQRPGPSYMIDTLRSFRETEGKTTPLCLLLGSDAFNGLESWKNWEHLSDYAHLVVFSRINHPFIRPFLINQRVDTFEACRREPSGLVYCHEANLPDISSTQIRHALENKTVASFLPPSVYSYIQEEGLYIA